MTINEAKSLKVGQTIYHRTAKNADGLPMRFKVNGRPRTWKRNPERVEVPIKYGLYEYGYMTQATIGQFDATDPGDPRRRELEETITSIREALQQAALETANMTLSELRRAVKEAIRSAKQAGITE